MQKKSKIKQNILQFIEKQGITKYTFYKETGITRGVLDQDNGINEDNIAKFLARYTQIDPTWLITGEGEMLRNSPVGIIQNGVKNKIEKSPVTINSASNCEDLREKIKHLEDLLEAKNEIINLLKNK